MNRRARPRRAPVAAHPRQPAGRRPQRGPAPSKRRADQRRPERAGTGRAGPGRGQRPGRRRAWTSALAAAALLAAGLAGVWAWRAGQPEDIPVPAAATADGTGLAVGTGPVTVEVYLDFLCPACRQFHDAARSTLDGYLADGTITVVYRPIAILDRLTTTAYSTRAGAAAGCAADRGSVDEFVIAMMAHQPPEGSAGLSDDEIVQIAAADGGGLAGPDFARCVRDGTYRDWVRSATDQAFDRGVQSTPTVFVDGTQLGAPDPGSLAAAIEQAAPAGNDG